MSVRLLTRLGAVAVLALLLACRGGEPVEAFLRFLDAIADRDADEAWELLAAESRSQLGEHARRLATVTGGAVQREARELLLATRLTAKRSKRAIGVAKLEGDRAVLRVALEQGGEDEVTMVREKGGWKVLLPGGRPPVNPAPRGAAPAPAVADGG